MISAIIIDDEPSAINVLALLLKKYCREDVQVIATSNSPQVGKSLIEEYKPELVFLDVEMPGMSGIDLVRTFHNPTFQVVFVTAYDAYALEAFRVSAIDYLLKPVEADDVINVIKKVKREKNRSVSLFTHQLQHLERLLQQNHCSSAADKIGIAMAEKIVFVTTADILYCEAKGSYTTVHLIDGGKLVASKSLGEFEALLAAQKFFRIHHSTLINLQRVREYQRIDGGNVMLENGIKLEVSQRKRKEFLDNINRMIV